MNLSPHLTSSSTLTLSHSSEHNDIRLTEHFKLSEFERSATAERLHVDNTPPESVVSNLKVLCENVLEPLRLHFGAPILITSGYRSPALNKAVGGSPTSQHMTGEAADIGSASSPAAIARLKEWFAWIMDNCDFDQLILEHTKGGLYWIHVSIKRDNTRNRHHVIQNLLKAPIEYPQNAQVSKHPEPNQSK